MTLDSDRLLIMDGIDSLAPKFGHEGRLQLIERCARATTEDELDAVLCCVMEPFWQSSGMDNLIDDLRGAA